MNWHNFLWVVGGILFPAILGGGGAFLYLWFSTGRRVRDLIPRLWMTKHEKDNLHLGWRIWFWSPYHERLFSPFRGAVWDTPELRVKAPWVDSEAVRGVAGVHARLLPEGWENKEHPDMKAARMELGEYPRQHRGFIVSGAVERHGRYVLGMNGWRAEWVMIKKLVVRTQAGYEALKAAYPDVEVVLVPKKGKVQ